MRVRAAVAAASVASVLLATSCRTPTEIVLDVTTNVKAGDYSGTAFTVASEPDEAERRVADQSVTATTTSLSPTGSIGTLGIVPSGSGENRIAVVVAVAFGATHDAASCKPPDYRDCIVARRTVAYVEHRISTLPIALDLDCLNVPCDAVSTCAHGKCYASSVSSNGDGFDTPGVSADGGVANPIVPDSGTPPTIPPPNPPPPPPSDGGSDASAAPPDSVDCMTTTCDVSMQFLCCYDQSDTSMNHCASGGSSPCGPNTIIECDSRDDCRTASNYCCAHSGGFSCSDSCFIETVCTTDVDCPGATPGACKPKMIFGHYGVCQ